MYAKKGPLHYLAEDLNVGGVLKLNLDSREDYLNIWRKNAYKKQRISWRVQLVAPKSLKFEKI